MKKSQAIEFPITVNVYLQVLDNCTALYEFIRKQLFSGKRICHKLTGKVTGAFGNCSVVLARLAFQGSDSAG